MVPSPTLDAPLEQTERSTRRFKIILFGLSFLGGLAVFLATRPHGAGLSPDSVWYVAMARNIQSGQGVLGYTGTPVSIWPPFYPALLSAVAILTGFDPASSAGAVNALLLGITIYAVGLLALTYMPRLPILALAVAMHTAIAIPLVFVSTMTWSEPLFACLLALYLLYSNRYLARPTYVWLIVTACVVALLCLTRYIGMVFVPVGLAVILFSSTSPIAVRLRHAVVFAAISVVPIGAWALRNHALTGTYFGGRSASTYTWSECISFTKDTIKSWYLPDSLARHGLTLFAVIAAFGLTVILASIVLARRHRGTRVACSQCQDRARLAPLLFVAVVYIAFLVYSSATSQLDPIGDRLLSPAFVPLTLLLVAAAYRVLEHLPMKMVSGRLAFLFFAALVVVSLAHPARVSAEELTISADTGQGYASETWRQNKTVAYARSELRDWSTSLVYTNRPDVLYILADFRMMKSTPWRTSDNDVSRLLGSWPSEYDSRVIWFTGRQPPYLFDKQSLEEIAVFYPLVQLDDGIICTVDPKKPSD